MCCNVLQCVALCCSVLQYVAVRTLQCVVHVLQCVAACCSVLQCVAVCCSVLQCAAVCCSAYVAVRSSCVAVCCSVLQCAAVCCSLLQSVAVCCGLLQCATVCCSAHVAVRSACVAEPLLTNILLKIWARYITIISGKTTDICKKPSTLSPGRKLIFLKSRPSSHFTTYIGLSLGISQHFSKKPMYIVKWVDGRYIRRFSEKYCDIPKDKPMYIAKWLYCIQRLSRYICI